MFPRGVRAGVWVIGCDTWRMEGVCPVAEKEVEAERCSFMDLCIMEGLDAVRFGIGVFAGAGEERGCAMDDDGPAGEKLEKSVGIPIMPLGPGGIGAP